MPSPRSGCRRRSFVEGPPRDIYTRTIELARPRQEASVRSPPRPRIVRLLHLLPDLEIGGGQTIVVNHLREANRGRFDIVVATLRSGGAFTAQFEAANGAPVIDLAHVGRRRVETIPRLVSLLRRQHIDLLHVHSDLDRKLGHAAALLARVPVVGHLHAEWIHLGPMSPARPTAIRRARAGAMGWTRDRLEARAVAHYVAESARVRDIFRPLVRQPITVLDQAISVDTFDDAAARRYPVRAALELPADAPILICVSRLVEGKGQGLLIEAMSRILPDDPGAVLLLVGDGPERSALEARAAALGVAGACRFLGSRTDIPDLLAAADLFLFASENEGFGLVVLEAMAASLPVVAFRLPALEEFVVAGTTGSLIDGRDPGLLAEEVSRYLSDPVRAHEAGVAGRRVVLERFDAGAVARSFEKVYDAVLDERAAAPGFRAS